MCSIAGFISPSKLTPDETKLLCRALLYHGATRGSQSAGLWLDGTLLKAAKDPEELYQSAEFDELTAKGAQWGLLHTRQPTSGGRGDEHAQPFITDDVVSVHNGVITNEKWLKDKFKLEPSTDVDSELFASYIAKEGPFKLDEFFKAMSGSAAIAFIHKARMFVARNNNPLEYITFGLPSKRGDITVFASTDAMLMNSLHHVWLMPSHLKARFVPANSLHEVAPKGLTQFGAYFSGYGGSTGHLGSHSHYDSADWHNGAWKHNRGSTLPKSLAERIEDLEREMKQFKNEMKQSRKKLTKEDVTRITKTLESRGAIVLQLEPGVSGKDLKALMQDFPDTDQEPSERKEKKTNGHDPAPSL